MDKWEEQIQCTKQLRTNVDKLLPHEKDVELSMDAAPTTHNSGHPQCIQTTDCKGTPESTLFRHVDEGRPGDLYFAECWAYCKECYPNADIVGVEEASNKDPNDITSEQQLGSGKDDTLMTNPDDSGKRINTVAECNKPWISTLVPGLRPPGMPPFMPLLSKEEDQQP